MADMTRGSSIAATWLHTVISGCWGGRCSALSMCSAPSTSVEFSIIMNTRLVCPTTFTTERWGGEGAPIEEGQGGSPRALQAV